MSGPVAAMFRPVVLAVAACPLGGLPGAPLFQRPDPVQDLPHGHTRRILRRHGGVQGLEGQERLVLAQGQPGVVGLLQQGDGFYRARCTHILENQGTAEEFAQTALALFQTLIP